MAVDGDSTSQTQSGASSNQADSGSAGIRSRRQFVERKPRLRVVVAAQLRGEPLPSPAYANTCYSVASDDYGISVVTQYRLSDDGARIEPIGGGTAPLEAAAEDLRREAAHAHAWRLRKYST